MYSQMGVCIKTVGKDYVTENNIKRVQICRKFIENNNLVSVLKLARDNDIKISYYLPLFHQLEPEKTYYLSSNYRLREATFEIFENNMKMLNTLSSDFVVVNFISDTINLEDLKTYNEVYTLAKESIKRLDNIGIKYNTDINIMYNRKVDYFKSTREWIELVKDSNRIKIDLDILELVDYCNEKNYSVFAHIEEMIPYVKSVYVSNLRKIDNLNNIILCMKKYNSDLPIIFESDIVY